MGGRAKSQEVSRMDIRQMQALTMVISTGNLSVAAEKIHVTPQALSKTVAQLERELGVTLFDRRKNKLIPTPVGVQIAQECAQLLAAFFQERRQAAGCTEENI